MRSWLKIVVLFLVAIFLSADMTMAQISGTNAVSVLGDNITNATIVSWPLTIGVITGLVALSVFLKIGRKGGARA